MWRKLESIGHVFTAEEMKNGSCLKASFLLAEVGYTSRRKQGVTKQNKTFNRRFESLQENAERNRNMEIQKELKKVGSTYG